jgi:uncharacterized protein with HEPN domain
MSRVYSLYLRDIIACGKVRLYVASQTFDDFCNDTKTVDAVVRNLEIIGEAVKNLPLEMREDNSNINWKKVARFRDIIAHHYFKVDLDIVWDITQNGLDDLTATVSKMLSELEKE